MVGTGSSSVLDGGDGVMMVVATAEVVPLCSVRDSAVRG